VATKEKRQKTYKIEATFKQALKKIAQAPTPKKNK